MEISIPRIPRETRKAYQGMMDYVSLGSARSLAKLIASYQKTTTPQPTFSLATLKTWSQRNRWQERIKSYLDQLESEQPDRVRERVIQLQELDYIEGDELRKVAIEVLKAEAPNFYRTTRKLVKGRPQIVDTTGKVLDAGEADREIIMVRLNIADVVRVIRTGSDLQRRTIPASTEIEDDQGGKIVIHQTNIIPQAPPDLSQYNDDTERTIPD